MDGFFRILKKAVSELICTRLYILKFVTDHVIFKLHYNQIYHMENTPGMTCQMQHYLDQDIYIRQVDFLHYLDTMHSKC